MDKYPKDRYNAQYRIAQQRREHPEQEKAFQELLKAYKNRNRSRRDKEFFLNKLWF
jgi:hypothetical protein